MKKLNLFLVVLGVVVASVFKGNAQLTITNDTTICAGQSVQLNVSGGGTYVWSPSTGLSSTTIANPVATPTVTTKYLVTSSVSSSNIAINGDFSQGNTGFTSSYHYQQAYDTTGPGDYTVGNDPTTWNTGFANCGTYNGAANMLMADGSLTANVPVWCETFPVLPNSNYTPIAYFEAMDEDNLPKMQWTVNGTLLPASAGPPFLECIWTKIEPTNPWNSGVNTIATFCIVDNLAGPAQGDDFALDDITIAGAVPMYDSVTITVAPAPSVNIGNDTTLCTGHSLTLNATTSGATYLWSTNATTPTISVNSAGTYWVAVNTGCTVRDSITVSYVSAPTPFNLGDDTTYCGGFSRVLSTGVAGTNWSTGAQAAQITVNTGGTYWATETNQCGTASDTIVLNQATGLTVNLGDDTTLCTGQQLDLNAFNASSTYLWSTGSTSASITVTSAGLYWVQVTNGCSVRDSITVGYTTAPAPFTLGNDTAYCGSFSQVLSTGYANTLWSTTATGAQITVTAPGTYWATETNQCGATSDTIVLNQNTAPVVSLGADTAICSTQTLVLDAGNAGATFNWSNNTHNETITTSSTGTYSVTVINGSSCSASASITVGSYTVPLTDTSVSTSCGSDNGLARAIVNNGRSPYHFEWSNNDTTPEITGLAAGSYQVTVTDASGCTASASVSISASGTNSLMATANNTDICPNDTAQICATAGFVSYIWSNSDTGLCISTNDAGDYSVTATDVGGCTASSQSVQISVRQPPSVTVSVSGDTLTSYPATTYQWYLNDTLIPGATSATYVATVSGNYTVVISDSHGCTAVSSVEQVVVGGINDLLNGADIKVFPNPLEDGNWTLQVTESLIGASVEMLDDNGRVVYKAILNQTQTLIDLTAAKGIYLLRIASGEQYFATKLVKL